MKTNKNLFAVAAKSIAFAWDTNRFVLLTLLLLSVFQGSIVYLQFTSFSNIVDEIIQIRQGAGTVSQLLWTSVILGASFLVPAVTATISSYFRVRFRMQQSVQLELYKIDKQSKLDIATLESNHYQTLLRGAQEWGSSSVLNLQDFMFTTATSLAGILTSVGILWALNKWLVLFAVLAGGPVYFFYSKYSMEVYRVRNLFIDDQRIITNRISHFEQLQKAVDVILLSLSNWLKHQIREKKISFNEKILAAERKKSVSYSLLSVWYLLFLFAAIGLMSSEALHGSIAVGGLLLAFNTYTRFYQTVNGYVESISWTEEAGRYAARWFELFDLEPAIQVPSDAIRMPVDTAPLIEFKNVSFHYPGETAGAIVLENLSFVIRPGEKTAIVGVNGAGKTTLIKLLCRVYDPSSGVILINGTDLKAIHPDDWHHALGVLFQDFPIYNLTIRESIAVGRSDVPADQAALERAAHLSGADEFITSYDQLIWKEFKNGIDLSKGQHQRLAVARMFYRNAPVTILDEPTASIDAVTEEKIFTALEKNMTGKTVILITHRFSTVKNASTILMLENGRLIELGSHRELMRLNGKYADLFTMQANRYLESGPE